MSMASEKCCASILSATIACTNSVDGTRFSINLIPHTLDATTLGSLKPSSRVNLEIDLIARYVERMLDPDAPESN